MNSEHSKEQPEVGAAVRCSDLVEPSRCAADLAGILRTFGIHDSSQS